MEGKRRWGPHTRFRLMRTCFVWLALIVCGGMIAVLSGSVGWRAFGLGIVLPGGGFLADGLGIGSLFLFALSLGVFVASVLTWFATGAVIAPPLVWFGLAIAASAGAGSGTETLLTTGLPMTVAGGAVALLAFVVGNQTQVTPPVASRFTRTEPVEPQPLEPEDLARLRFILDRALQPIDQFDGFQWVDQFQPAGIRYQLNFAGYALALTQVRLPAFRGYLHEAQRRLIEKQLDWRVWRYWRLEEASGSLRLNADPIIRDSIMYLGFVGAQVAYFQAATGDQRYSERGAFTLRTPRDSIFEHDFTTMTDALMCGWRSSPYALMPCEPNWVYPMCNAIGASAVIARDRQSGEAMWPQVSDALRAGLETELTMPSGRFVAFRSTLTGLPDIAERVWGISRRDMLTSEGAANRKHFWRTDTGDYRFSRAASCTSVAAAAAELGDFQVMRAALDLLDEDCPAFAEGGVAQRKNAPVFAHFVEVMVRQGGPDALRSLVHGGLREPQGPVLDVNDYPATLWRKPSGKTARSMRFYRRADRAARDAFRSQTCAPVRQSR